MYDIFGISGTKRTVRIIEVPVPRGLNVTIILAGHCLLAGRYF